jgi:tRNA dimethylallyltransferase
MPSVIAIIGPTAVGKTALSLKLAKRLNGEIVSMDSRLIYRGMDIGTAKPSLSERNQVPHHLIDVACPNETWSLARFRTAALQAIEDILERGCLPVLVGGTGQYVTAILEGWIPPPKPAEPSFREELERQAQSQGAEALHERLRRIDPQAAERIDARNVRRVIRALEIFHAMGSTPTALRKKVPPPFRSLRIGLNLPRKELYARIDARIDTMIEDGLLEEVRKLLNEGYDAGLPAMSAIGYRQMVRVLAGEYTMEEAVLEMRRLTRQFVRRQANWFKADDPGIHWFDLSEDLEGSVLRLIRSWLAEPQG